MKRFVALFLLLALLTACGGTSTVLPTVVPAMTPTQLPADVYEVPLTSYTNVSGCDYNDKPCGSGQNGKTPGYHTGIDYWGNPVGDNETVLASGPGIVVETQINGKNDHGMGYAVILQHFPPDGSKPIYTLYAHLQSIDSGVSKGKCIGKDSPIGVMGASGYGQAKYWSKTTPHLHFEFKTKPVLGDPKSNPEKYWGYIPETETDPNPDSWGYLNPNKYIGIEKALRCEALAAVPTNPKPSLVPTSTRTPPAPVPTPTPPASPTVAPVTNNLRSVAMLSATNGWIVGDSGTILRWDGSTWRQFTSSTSINLSAVVMTSPTEGWAIGGDYPGTTLLRWDGATWSLWETFPNIYGELLTSGTDAWGIDDSGNIVHWDGSKWSVSATPNAMLTSFGVDANKDFWVTKINPVKGYGPGTILHWDGHKWKELYGADSAGNYLSFLLLTAISATDIWVEGTAWTTGRVNGFYVWQAVSGEDGQFFHWDGVRWNMVNKPTQAYIAQMVMVSPTDGWAVGTNGTILHWDGHVWTLISSPVSSSLYSVAMVSPADGWAVGEYGTILHWNGITWSFFNPHQLPTPTAFPTVASPAGTTPNLSSVLARPNGQITAASYRADPPTIDGNLDDWPDLPNVTDQVTFGATQWHGASDLSMYYALAWDNEYLYLAAQVTDDVHVQTQHGAAIFKGDSLDMLLDTDLAGDFNDTALSADDFQLGLSPGAFNGEAPESWLWLPRSISGVPSNVTVAAQPVGTGYAIEAQIPWALFGVTPIVGQHFGFALSASDNDTSGTAQEQSLVSSVSTRRLTDPTTWSTLGLVK